MSKNVLLGVSGSIAAYRACDLSRELKRAGCEVRVCLTRGAAQFITPALMEGLTGQPCLVDSFDEPERGQMAHIEWARQTDLMVVAPATANVLAKLAQGVADDMLTTLALAYQGRLLVAPAMNPTMFDHDAVQLALETLRQRGAEVVEPEGGQVACGESGQGKLASVAVIAEQALAMLEHSSRLAGKRVLITSGPTQERLDDVRFLSNRSSGKMGAALAKAALWMGAQVTVISGPVSARYPALAKVIPVLSAEQMLVEALAQAAQADIILGAAAVADYRPENPVAGKIRRDQDALTVKLVKNPDIVAELAQVAPRECVVVAFAAEPDQSLEHAQRKMLSKRVHAIAVNDVSRRDAGFEVETNELTLLRQSGEPARSGLRTKLGCAVWLLEQLTSP